MGGNALRHLDPVRLTSIQVVNLFNHLARNWGTVSDTVPYLVPWVAEKETHGDIDIVVTGDLGINGTTLRRILLLVGGGEGFVRNDKVVSVPVPLPWNPSRIAQVDFIFAKSYDDSALRFFYAGGDFGMMLGRVAAAHGLVFGMDGLRLRADPQKPWSKDIVVSCAPPEILRALGYPSILPYFDTYETMWRFIMSSPMADPWMFLPDATNADNRSRDKQRTRIAQFQNWVRENYPNAFVGVRKSFDEALALVDALFPGQFVRDQLARQKDDWDRDHENIRILGVAAVKAVIGDDAPMAVVGDIVKEMQPHLPAKADRDVLLDNPFTRRSLVNEARALAYAIALRKGLSANLPVRDG